MTKFDDLGYKAGDIVKCVGSQLVNKVDGQIVKDPYLMKYFKLSSTFDGSTGILISGNVCHYNTGDERNWRAPRQFELENIQISTLVEGEDGMTIVV